MTSQRFIQEFYDLVVERRRSTASPWVPVDPNRKPVTNAINEWIKSKQAIIYDVKRFVESTEPQLISVGRDSLFERTTSLTYVILYELPVQEAELSQQAVMAAIPARVDAVSPTMEVTLNDPSANNKRINIMVGTFGVKEGQKFSQEDEEPAPIPVFSPDLDLGPYSFLFGNIKPKGADKGADNGADRTNGRIRARDRKA